MSDSDKLLGKADAFLSRFRPSAPREAAPVDIPVLTDVVAVQSEVAAVTHEVPAENDAWTPAQLEEIEARLHTRLLETIGPYIENFLDEPLRVRLEESLRRTLDALTDHVKADVEVLVRDAVTAAVTHELARLRTSDRDESR